MWLVRGKVFDPRVRESSSAAGVIVGADLQILRSIPLVAQAHWRFARDCSCKVSPRLVPRGVKNVLSDLSELLLGPLGHSLGHVLSESVSQ